MGKIVGTKRTSTEKNLNYQCMVFLGHSPPPLKCRRPLRTALKSRGNLDFLVLYCQRLGPFSNLNFDASNLKQWKLFFGGSTLRMGFTIYEKLNSNTKLCQKHWVIKGGGGQN